MLILKFKNRKGNSSIEYAFLIALVIGALLGMQAYLKRPICQRWRLAGDAFGFGRQYVAGTTPTPRPTPAPPVVVDPGGDEFSLVYKAVFPNPIEDFVRIMVNIPKSGGVVTLILKESAEGKTALTISEEFSIGGNEILIEGDTSSLSNGGPYFCDLYFDGVRIYKNFDKAGKY